MKSLIIYYSRFGNTAHVAYKFLEALSKKGEADIFELRYSGRRGFLYQILSRIFRFRIDLGKAPLDVKDYDLVCIGVPVRARRPAFPAAEYIRRCRNAKGKTIVCLQVYGAEASAKVCFEYVRRILDKKGALKIVDMSISWLKAHDDEYIGKLIQEAV